ncbi:bifunctional adenosylcobinamide kinase/adenosylcobinamide-phosphate guanylyltransferase [Tateyamaria omphalii]|uniref:bifunctional adenosylcobinamide kinase/adenosylcobinamide-phosphate guanylyltransferase n=1 Tax=Tateyamaria omphalii TaxID=299262 RepID=UPI001C998E38|nr:bifunctional adenosylcobinamide kinase/adenosylcobinamide-phosphate guanylyltransferase [Tateyamaria omphalii]MBY5934839.1 bifunctional adenosylcobinamide kinase/adenosylcobinamide-phosphate guanylyltransferase [Tateyamaria omphalii]
MLPALTLVLGGAASGKSQWAESLILNSGLNPVYLATSRIWDEEMQAKVDLHKARRGAEWTTVDAANGVRDGLAGAGPDQALLLDCATMWLTNLMMDEADIVDAQASLLTDLARCAAPVVVVSNEVGQSIVPENALARRFREAQGRLNIALAAQADTVWHVLAGLPQLRKGDAP